MATYRKRNGRWNAVVRVNDKQISKTFDTKTEAKVWALGIERGLKINPEKARPTPPDGDTFGRLLRAYRRQVTPTNSQAKDEKALINRLLNEPFTEVSLRALTMDDLTSFRDKRLFEDGVSTATVDRDFRVMKAVVNYAHQCGKTT